MQTVTEERRYTRGELDDAALRRERIIARQRAIELTFVDQGEDLYQVSICREYEMHGYASFEAFVASPEINIGIRSAHLYKSAYEVFVLSYGIERERLAEIGISKLDMIRPYVDANNIESLLASASTLSRSSLLKYLVNDERNQKRPDYSVPDEYQPPRLTFKEPAEVQLRVTTTWLLNELLRLRPDYNSRPVVRTAVKVLRITNTD